MTRRGRIAIGLGALAAMAGCVVGIAVSSRPPAVTDAQLVDRAAAIRPDYAGVAIPPNIAPLNFVVLEPGRRYEVRIGSARGRPIRIRSASPGIVIPPRRWRELLSANRGEALRFEVCVQAEAGRWRRFRPIVNTIAPEPIDGHLVYRLIRPLYNLYRDVGIYQRELGTYAESLVLHSRTFQHGCVNCHTFLNHRTDRMLLHIRGRAGVAMLMGGGGKVTRVDTRTKFNPSPAAYSCWHPSGKFVTFSVNKLKLFYHAAGETRDVFDAASDMGNYLLPANAVKSTGKITQPQRLETFPNWAPDGRSLYFSSAPRMDFRQYRQVRYDLIRLPYDPEADTWGSPQTVLSAREMNSSIVEPRVSPDGRYVMVCLCEYGGFPVYQPSSDLHLLDLRTGRCRKLPVNSDRCESWHCWSSNSRWFVFASKRRDGVFAKPYFSYLHPSGRAEKPFVLPQGDPEFYESFLKTYNVPELIAAPVPYSQRDFVRALSAGGALTAEAVSGATPKPQ